MAQIMTKGRKGEMENKVVLTVREAAKVLRISHPSAYQAIKKGEIPAIRIGHRILVPVAAFEKLLGTKLKGVK